MRRWILLLLTIFFATIGFGFMIFWLFGTTEGARWMMSAISRWTPVQIDAQKISGQIGRQLKMEELRVYWPKGEIKVEGFDLHWEPLHLLMGKVVIEDLALQGVQIHDHRPQVKTTPDFEWPTAPSLFLWVHAEVKYLHVKDFLYRRQNHNPLKVEKLSTHLHWSYGLLTLEKMDLGFPPGVVKGTVELGLVRPGLYLHLNLSPSKAMDGIDLIHLNSRLLPARGPEQVAGHVFIEGISRSVKQLLIESEIGITQSAVILRTLLITRPNRNGTLTGDGRIIFSADDVLMNLKMKFSDLDLSQELKVNAAFSGAFNLEGSPNDYRGDIRIENTKGKWYSGSLSGNFRGTLKGAYLTIVDGSMLDGNFQGHLNALWNEGLSLNGALRIRNLNPAGITPDWDGKINLDLEGAFHWPKGKSPEGKVQAYLPKSYLRGQPLTGGIELHMEKSILRLVRADLKGKGIELFARGSLQERLIFNADISDLSGLIPGTRGRLFSNGWVRWKNQRLAFDLNSQGKEILIKDVEFAGLDLSARFDEGEEAPAEIKAKFRKVAYGSFRMDSVTLNATGKLPHHRMAVLALRPEGQIECALEGNYFKGEWRGLITYLSGSDAGGTWTLQVPSAIHVSPNKIKVDSLQIHSTHGETFQFHSDLALRPLRGTLRGKWHRVNLARANPWLSQRRLSGSTTGNLFIQFLEEAHLRIAGAIDLEGTFNDPSLKIEVSWGRVKFEWNEKKLLASAEFELPTGGKLLANVSAPEPARMAFPDRGTVAANWEGIDLCLLKPYLPPYIALEGSFIGSFFGQWSNMRFDAAGELKLSRGTVRWQHEERLISASFPSAELHWAWRDEFLRGRISFELVEYGHAKGNFQLPLSARFPVAIRPEGPMEFSLNGKFEEKGLLHAFFPGIIQQSRAQIHFNLNGNGTWEKPKFEGDLKLEKAGAYLPGAGIHLEECSVEAHFKGEEIRITSFRTRSGPGQIEGEATVRIENWKVSYYQGHLKGERFQVIQLPEMRVLSSPRLDFHGNTQKLFVRGEILLPDLLVSGPPVKDVIRSSPDAIIVEALEASKPGLPLAVDIQVRVFLGEKVYYKAGGIDARLKGDLRLDVEDPYKITVEGEISAAQGHYSFHGHQLDIVRGRLVFTGGPADDPAVDALAVRKIGEVQAGVAVTGTLKKPEVRLYSRPSMPDTDILAYIVLGQPLGKGSGQVPSLAQAAGALLSAGESVILQGQLKKLFGLDTLDITTPPGGNEVSRSMVTIGKYLTPKLYISLGRSLFTDATVVALRYSFSKRLEVETTTGTDSGATLFYRIEFR